MTQRKTILTRTIVGAAACTLVLACSSSSSNSSGDGGSTTPSGTTPQTMAPYPVCTALEQGAFTTTSGGAYTEPTTKSCSSAGMPTSGAADTHCAGMPPTTVKGSDCNVMGGDDGGGDDGGGSGGDDGGGSGGDAGMMGDDGGGAPTPGPCGENGPDYGATMYGTAGDDDDCKYHVTYTASPICENNGTYFVVKADYLAGSGGPLTGAATFAELCLSDTHPAPAIDARPPNGSQQVVEGPPGTYTIGPVQFDAPGNWTVRFHFNEFCCDGTDNSPHGHAAFHITVP
ncbi:MAG TPA: hypothetical protein VMI75_36485 [Polyangiaceae bacterium]|nr:hypothetical protein [Polyangiaceae bacterium]